MNAIFQLISLAALGQMQKKTKQKTKTCWRAKLQAKTG